MSEQREYRGLCVNWRSPRTPFRRFCVLVFVALAVLSACDGATGPPALARAPLYALLELDGAPLPVRNWVSGTDTSYLMSELVTLRKDGIAEFRRVVRVVGVGGAERSESMKFDLWYVVARDSIWMDNRIACFTLPCPQLTMIGVLTDAEMQVESEASSVRWSLLYVRVLGAASR